MLDELDQGGGTDNPRLQAILELLKFLSKSESDRAMPKDPKPPEAAPAPEGEPEGDELEALKHLAR